MVTKLLTYKDHYFGIESYIPYTRKTQNHQSINPGFLRKILLFHISKYSGIDDLPATVLNKCNSELTPVLTLLSQASYDKDIFQDSCSCRACPQI